MFNLLGVDHTLNIEYGTLNTTTPSPHDYPGPDTLCEDCGYALKGLQSNGNCPECGLPIAESSPAKRTGPHWHNHPSPGSAINLIYSLATRPRHFFRTMRVDGSNTPARLFLLMVALLIGLIWLCAIWTRNMSSNNTTWALIQTAIVCDGVIVLSYIEAVGVVYFSRRRGWRVPFKLAERIVCYCSLGWIPTALLMLWVLNLLVNGSVDRWMQRLMPAWEYWQSLALMILFFAGAMMWFEVLVWVGVRQAKYANS